MKKIREWIINNYLPMWAKETVLKENRSLRAECDELKQKLEIQGAYLAGMEAGTRAMRRIVINNNGRVNGDSAEK